jgi:hypothetical protein
MLGAVGIAVVPLVAVSRNELRHVAREAEQRIDQRWHNRHEGRGRGAIASYSAASGPDHTPGRTRSWHEPILLKTR